LCNSQSFRISIAKAGQGDSQRKGEQWPHARLTMSIVNNIKINMESNAGQSLEFQKHITEVYFNYEKINKTLSKKYPVAFAEFNSFEVSNSDFPFCYFEFFYSFNIAFRYKETDVFNPNYSGTFSYRILINKQATIKLNRKNSYFSYYGLNNKVNAVEKLIDKAFQIIECLLTDRELPEKLRRV
jgi:hypothetical protein